MLLKIQEPSAPNKVSQEAVVGIDLGTTNSAVAYVKNNKPQVLTLKGEQPTIPSVLAFGNEPEPLVGNAAKSLLPQQGVDVIGSIKRLMGKAVEDITAPLGFRLAQTPKGEIAKIATKHKDYTAVELSAFILRRLKQRAEAVLGKPIHKAVITVPAYFDDGARCATKDAAKLAGLTALRLVNEPTAAALAYGLDKKRSGTVAVYDLGGGTFDISILKLTKGVFRVLATGGDTQLGGDDLDQAIADELLANKELAPQDLAKTLAAVRALREELTTKPQAQVEIEGMAFTLTRVEMEKIIAPVVGKTLAIASQVVEDISPATIDEVVMVGGATRMPSIRKAVGELFNLEPKTDINPDEVVALGAALQAHALSGGGGNLLLDVIPLSLGLETMGGIVTKIIDRNTPIPVSKAQEFTTQKDGQTALSVHVLQGEREMASQCRSLARFELHHIPPMAAGLARIQITFAIDADGLLNVTAKELTTSKTQHIEVKPSYGISTTTMRKMLEESMQYAKQDMQERLLAEAKVEANSMLEQLRSALAKDGEIATASEKASIETASKTLEKSLLTSERETIIQNREALEKACQTFIERRINKALGSALKGKSVEQVEKNNA